MLPLRAEIIRALQVTGEKHLQVCVVLTSTGVTMVQFCFFQPNLSTTIKFASPVLFFCGRFWT